MCVCYVIPSETNVERLFTVFAISDELVKLFRDAWWESGSLGV